MTRHPLPWQTGITLPARHCPQRSQGWARLPSALCMPSMISSSRPGLERTSAKEGTSARERCTSEASSEAQSLILRAESLCVKCNTAKVPAGSQTPREKDSFCTSDVSKEPLRTMPRQMVQPSMATEDAKFMQLRCYRVKVVGIGRGCHDERGIHPELRFRDSYRDNTA